jgi:hypothetical protein
MSLPKWVMTENFFSFSLFAKLKVEDSHMTQLGSDYHFILLYLASPGLFVAPVNAVKLETTDRAASITNQDLSTDSIFNHADSTSVSLPSPVPSPQQYGNSALRKSVFWDVP